eukprot:361505-Chlamydomonas_euryale.AAC.9
MEDGGILAANTKSDGRRVRHKRTRSRVRGERGLAATRVRREKRRMWGGEGKSDANASRRTSMRSGCVGQQGATRQAGACLCLVGRPG